MNAAQPFAQVGAAPRGVWPSRRFRSSSASGWRHTGARAAQLKHQAAWTPLQSPPQKQRLTLAQYIRRRNGVAAGSRGSLRNMLDRSLGAGTFAGFWRHWNPVFGYHLGRYVDAPLRSVIPPPFALIATFVVCGALHDLVTAVVRGAPAFLFTPWFFFLGIGVVLGRVLRLDFSGQSWLLRAATNLAYVAVCLVATLAIGFLVR